MRIRFIAVQPRPFSLQRQAQLGLDAVILALGIVAAHSITQGRLPEATLFVGVLVLRLGLRQALGLHLPLWRFFGLYDYLRLSGAMLLGSALVAATTTLLGQAPGLGFLALEAALGLGGLLAARAACRLRLERPSSGPRQRRRVLLAGAGHVGNTFAREILRTNPEIELVGFVDDDAGKRGRRVQGLVVLGCTEDVPELVAELHVDEIILCMAKAPSRDLRRIVAACQRTAATVKIVPGLQAMLQGRVGWSQAREVRIEDLLAREPVQFDPNSAARYLSGRVVLVTGAGGSIGSELCRQIAAVSPSRLVLVGRGEATIFQAEMELKEQFSDLPLEAVIADVRDANRMQQVFAQHLPDVVFHAAAHKHVPLMERHPGEAVMNNIIGTRIVAELADHFGVSAFVLVSTDKAVNPTSVMGATKRVAELVVTSIAARSHTRFMAVRFGNVLGSRGSVVTVFQRQIDRGGPVTITAPDIYRYFMTPTEAARLVIEAGAIGRGGEVFVLDMGEPVRIVDLARDMIRMSGLEPEVDMAIQFTGLRPGEKLYEELLTDEEGTTSTTRQRIHIARPDVLPQSTLDAGLYALINASQSGNPDEVKAALKHLVPTYAYAPCPAAEPSRRATP